MLYACRRAKLNIYEWYCIGLPWSVVYHSCGWCYSMINYNDDWTKYDDDWTQYDDDWTQYDDDWTWYDNDWTQYGDDWTWYDTD